MLGHVTTITHKNNLVLSNIDPGAGGTSTKKVKIGNLPNIFDDDCRYVAKNYHCDSDNARDYHKNIYP